MAITILPGDALIIVDIQNDFLPGGALPVDQGDLVLFGINVLMDLFHKKGARVILTQDWHPPGHLSFASQHKGKGPFDPISDVHGIGPILWPDHCVQGTKGAQFHEQLNQDAAHLVLRKGFHPKIDSYSAFIENDQESDTGLSGYLKNAGVTRIFIGGLALDYCVAWSALDGNRKGFETFVVRDLCQGISEETTRKALADLEREGIQLVHLNHFQKQGGGS